MAWERYNVFRNVYCRTIRAATLIYYTKTFNIAKGKEKQTWDIANEVTCISKKSSHMGFHIFRVARILEKKHKHVINVM